MTINNKELLSSDDPVLDTTMLISQESSVEFRNQVGIMAGTSISKKSM